MINQVYEIEFSSVAGLEVGGQYHWNALSKAISVEGHTSTSSWEKFISKNEDGDVVVLAFGLHKPFELDMNVPVNDVLKYDLATIKLSF